MRASRQATDCQIDCQITTQPSGNHRFGRARATLSTGGRIVGGGSAAALAPAVLWTSLAWMTLTTAVVGLTATAAYADCPTTTNELPPVGFLADATRLATEPLSDHPPVTPPKLQAHAAAAGGMRAEGADLDGTASLGGQVSVRRGGYSACASGDVIDVRAGAAHATASAQFPFFFTGISIGGSIDRNVRLPLSVRPELFRAPVSRVASQFSIAFIDFELTEKQDALRIQVMPVAVEGTLTTQDDGVQLDRYTSSVAVAMFRFLASEPNGTGELSFFDIDIEYVELGERISPEMPGPGTGFARISPVSIKSERERWSFELDGGWLSIAGDVDCETVRCSRGFYVGALRHSWRQIAVETRAERSAFIATNNEPAFEDRLSMTTTVDDLKRSATASAFIARTEAWHDGTLAGRTAGLRVSLAHQLKAGFAALVDGEVARVTGSVPAAEAQPLPAEAGRVLVSLAWRRRTTR